MMLPSRIAGTPASMSRKLALLDAIICSGKVICSTNVEEGIIKTRKGLHLWALFFRLDST